MLLMTTVAIAATKQSENFNYHYAYVSRFYAFLLSDTIVQLFSVMMSSNKKV